MFFFIVRLMALFPLMFYRKPTHTGRYLPYTSHHPTIQKLSIARTLYSRAGNIINKSEHKLAEFDHIYPKITKQWVSKTLYAPAINFLLSRLNLTLDLNRLTHTLLLSQFHMCRGVSEPIKRVLAQVGIGVALKPHCMLSSVFRKPKDRIVESEKSGLVYENSMS